MANYDCIVLGLGGIGSATLYQAALRGFHCLGIEQFSAAHHRGSSHGHSRLIRKAYFEHPNYVPLVTRAYQLWDDIQLASGESLCHKIGLAQFGPAAGVIMQGIEASVKEHSLNVDRVSPAEFMNAHPQFFIPEDMSGIVEHDAGVLLVERCVETHLQQAKLLGAAVLLEHPVNDIRPTRDGVEVVVDGETHACARLIIAAGAWSQTLVGLSLPLRVVRKHLHWYDTNGALTAPDTPAFFFHMPEGFFYGAPAMHGKGLKAAEHGGGKSVDDPSALNRAEEPLDRQRVDQFVANVFHDSPLTHSDHEVCMYTMSPDEHFIVDLHPQYCQIAFAAGMSGHGFKFAPVIAELLLDLAMDGTSILPAEFLKYSRFAAT